MDAATDPFRMRPDIGAVVSEEQVVNRTPNKWITGPAKTTRVCVTETHDIPLVPASHKR